MAAEVTRNSSVDEVLDSLESRALAGRAQSCARCRHHSRENREVWHGNLSAVTSHGVQDASTANSWLCCTNPQQQKAKDDIHGHTPCPGPGRHSNYFLAIKQRLLEQTLSLNYSKTMTKRMKTMKKMTMTKQMKTKMMKKMKTKMEKTKKNNFKIHRRRIAIRI